MIANSRADRPSAFQHVPAGLYILFFTELWERFSYYGMRAIFTLFLVAKTTDTNPGFGWSKSDALALYGWYTMMVYVAAIAGGVIADRILGQRRTVMVGGLLLCTGHSILFFNSELSFYVGCIFIVCGVGCLKPNISSMVGGLYAKGDPKRDVGFYIFYMGINIGGFLAPIICGYVGETINWHYGFGLAAVGMFLGQLVYIAGQKFLKGVGDPPTASKKSNAERATPLTKIEKDRIKVLFFSFILIILFWAAFEQAGGLMNLYASEKIDRRIGSVELPASLFQSVNAFFIITLATAVGAFWFKRKSKGAEASSLFKMSVGIIIMAAGFGFMAAAAIQYQHTGSSSFYWLILAYLFHTVGELCASPVSLSFITKLAPERYMSVIMGANMAAIGIGNKLAGILGQQAEQSSDLTVFASIAIIWSAIGIVMLFLIKPLNRLTHGEDDFTGNET